MQLTAGWPGFAQPRRNHAGANHASFWCSLTTSPTMISVGGARCASAANPGNVRSVPVTIFCVSVVPCCTMAAGVDSGRPCAVSCAHSTGNPSNQMNGSPPFSLSTRWPSCASRTSSWLMDSCGSVCWLRALPASPVFALQSAASNIFFNSLPRHLGATVSFDMNFFYYCRVTEDSGRYLRNDKKHQLIIEMPAVSTPEIPAPRLITAFLLDRHNANND